MNRKKCNKLQKAISSIVRIMNDCLTENRGSSLRHLPTEEDMRQLKILAEDLTKTVKEVEARRSSTVKAMVSGKKTIVQKGKYDIKKDNAYNVPEDFRAMPRAE
jgi:hypothetical protein